MFTHTFSLAEKRMLKYLLAHDGLSFTRYFYKNQESRKYIVNAHHRLMNDAKRKVFSGEIKRLIINIPPGYSKTHEWVVSFMAQGLALNPQALFMHLSYSDELALWNSTQCRDIVESAEYQELFPMRLRRDVSAKKKWYTEQGGGVYATSAGGQVTGFRAGRIIDPEEAKRQAHTFWGALIIDDPIKPDDAYSNAIRDRINGRFMNTFRSRLAEESETPMILVAQRIHEQDPSGFLLTGGSGEKWYHLLLPVEIPPTPINDWYPPHYTHGIPLPYNLPPGPLWEYKHSENQIASMRRADSYTVAAQYDQQPSSAKHTLFRPEYWRYYSCIPENIILKRIYADTAQKTGEHNDYTVFQCWGYAPGVGILLLDMFRNKLEAPQLERALITFWNKHKTQTHKNPVGAQIIKVEDKSSGSSLIQNIRQKTNIPIDGIPRHRDKLMRAMDCLPQIESGNVWLPIDAPWLHDLQEECRQFSPLLTHRYDDQIDPMLDAIYDLLIDRVHIYDGI